MYTKFGNFEVSDNGKGGVILSMKGVQIIQFPTTPWWDKDTMLKRLEKNKKVVEKRIAEKFGKETPKEQTLEDIVTDYKELKW
jgi:hypothetical protein